MDSLRRLARKISSSCWVLSCLFSGIFSTAVLAQQWTVAEVLKNLASTPTGSQIVSSANAVALGMGANLLQIVVPGNFSATSTNFIFRFNPQNPVETLTELQVTVILDKNVPLDEATWHLAHELTHFVRQDLANPYDLNNPISAIEDIVETIEGKGGEVDAFIVGCRVFDELTGGLVQHPICSEMTDGDGEIDREEVVKRYYRVGPYYQDFVRELDARGVSPTALPHLSDEASFFNSQGSQFPYPIAIFMGYLHEMRQVCATHNRRLQLMDSASESYQNLSSQVESYCLN